MSAASIGGVARLDRGRRLSNMQRVRHAAVAELADAQDSGSCTHKVWRFDSSQPHSMAPVFPFGKTGVFRFLGITRQSWWGGVLCSAAAL